jgi:hypothetical protein
MAGQNLYANTGTIGGFTLSGLSRTNNTHLYRSVYITNGVDVPAASTLQSVWSSRPCNQSKYYVQYSHCTRRCHWCQRTCNSNVTILRMLLWRLKCSYTNYNRCQWWRRSIYTLPQEPLRFEVSQNQQHNVYCNTNLLLRTVELTLPQGRYSSKLSLVDPSVSATTQLLLHKVQDPIDAIPTISTTSIPPRKEVS